MVDHESKLLQRVWLILAKVKVTGEECPAGFSVGSEALVQCFVPVTNIEAALTECDRLLSTEGMLRTDVLKCVSFEEVDDEDGETPDFVKRDVLQARESGKAMTGTFFFSRDTASFIDPPDEEN